MVTAVVETTVIVDLLRGHPPAVAWLEGQTEAELAVTPIVWMEVVGGGPNKALRTRAVRLMERFELLRLTSADQDWAMRQQMAYELSHGTGMMDCLIASVAHRLELPLFTHNLKHFAPLLGELAQKPY